MTEFPPTSFPVVFFDGDRDVDVGDVAVTPSTDFKRFQALISQKIGGISPHKISISLVRRKKARSSPEIRRKIPIDESSDFSSIYRERDSFILAVMWRSRSGRRGRGRRRRHVSAAAAAEEIKTVEILKRNHHQEDRFQIGSLGFWDYEAQMRSLERMRERYLISTGLYYSYTSPPVADVFRSPPAMPPVCEECVEAEREGRSVGFHWCVCDQVVAVGFRSPAGPIERPTKKNLEGSA